MTAKLYNSSECDWSGKTQVWLVRCLTLSWLLLSHNSVKFLSVLDKDCSKHSIYLNLFVLYNKPRK